ncbi:MAG: DoxX family protein [Patescibacteria group bacterium]
MKDDLRKIWLTMTATRPMWGMFPMRIIFGVMLILGGLSRFLLFQQDPLSLLASIPGATAFAIIVIFSVIEIIGGVFMVSGFLSRFISFFIIVEMMMSIAIERIPLDFSRDLQTQVLILAIASMILFSGAGRFSVDRYIARRLLDKFPNKKKELYCIAETPYTRWWE